MTPFGLVNISAAPNGGAVGLQPSSPSPRWKLKKNTDFVDTIILSVFRDLYVSRYQPL